jgi:putative aldouronate transport system permease protein
LPSRSYTHRTALIVPDNSLLHHVRREFLNFRCYLWKGAFVSTKLASTQSERSSWQGVAVADRAAARRPFAKTLRRIWYFRYIYLLMLPGLLYFLIFRYVPMWGIIIAFQEFRLWQGILGSPWVGFQHFETFFQAPYFWRLFANTLIISGLNLLIVFPAPILLALLLNEVRHSPYKRLIQTVSYLPHFISWVVVGGMLIYMFSVTVGFFNITLARWGYEPIPVLGNANAFLPLVVGSAIWKGIGWGAIIFLAAIAGVNPELYEAATMDGANRLQRVLYVTLPCIAPVIVIMLILNIGQLLDVNFYQLLILMGGDASLYEVGDVFDTWVYRMAFFRGQMSLATAVGLFKGVIGLVLIWGANRIANRVSDGGLW